MRRVAIVRIEPTGIVLRHVRGMRRRGREWRPSSPSSWRILAVDPRDRRISLGDNRPDRHRFGTIASGSTVTLSGASTMPASGARPRYFPSRGNMLRGARRGKKTLAAQWQGRVVGSGELEVRWHWLGVPRRPPWLDNRSSGGRRFARLEEAFLGAARPLLGPKRHSSGIGRGGHRSGPDRDGAICGGKRLRGGESIRCWPVYRSSAGTVQGRGRSARGVCLRPSGSAADGIVMDYARQGASDSPNVLQLWPQETPLPRNPLG